MNRVMSYCVVSLQSKTASSQSQIPPSNVESVAYGGFFYTIHPIAPIIGPPSLASQSLASFVRFGHVVITHKYCAFILGLFSEKERAIADFLHDFIAISKLWQFHMPF